MNSNLKCIICGHKYKEHHSLFHWCPKSGRLSQFKHELVSFINVKRFKGKLQLQ